MEIAATRHVQAGADHRGPLRVHMTPTTRLARCMLPKPACIHTKSPTPSKQSPHARNVLSQTQNDVPGRDGIALRPEKPVHATVTAGYIQRPSCHGPQHRIQSSPADHATHPLQPPCAFTSSTNQSILATHHPIRPHSRQPTNPQPTHQQTKPTHPPINPPNPANQPTNKPTHHPTD